MMKALEESANAIIPRLDCASCSILASSSAFLTCLPTRTISNTIDRSADLDFFEKQCDRCSLSIATNAMLRVKRTVACTWTRANRRSRWRFRSRHRRWPTDKSLLIEAVRYKNRDLQMTAQETAQRGPSRNASRMGPARRPGSTRRSRSWWCGSAERHVARGGRQFVGRFSDQ